MSENELRLPKGLLWRLRNNWANSWEVWRFELDVEWVPRARYYTFGLTYSNPKPDDSPPV